jgi:2-amino-4-hydroxy-6-hydroxymethyldihydropteridine diphosphokinase
METVYLMLGGNVGPTELLFQQAREALQQLGTIECSRVYQTRPISPIPQADYLNQACRLRTGLAPQQLLEVLQAIEKRLGKVPKLRDAPRPIDLDLIFYGSRQINSPGLIVPHPRWRERLFVVRPLRDLIEGILIEDQWVSLDELLQRFPEEQRDWVVVNE